MHLMLRSANIVKLKKNNKEFIFLFSKMVNWDINITIQKNI